MTHRGRSVHDLGEPLSSLAETETTWLSGKSLRLKTTLLDYWVQGIPSYLTLRPRAHTSPRVTRDVGHVGVGILWFRSVRNGHMNIHKRITGIR